MYKSHILVQKCKKGKEKKKQNRKLNTKKKRANEQRD